MSWHTDGGSLTWVTNGFLVGVRFTVLQSGPWEITVWSVWASCGTAPAKGGRCCFLSSRGKPWALLLPSAILVNVTRFYRREGVKVTKKLRNLRGKIHPAFCLLLRCSLASILGGQPDIKSGRVCQPNSRPSSWPRPAHVHKCGHSKCSEQAGKTARGPFSPSKANKLFTTSKTGVSGVNAGSLVRGGRHVQILAQRIPSASNNNKNYLKMYVFHTPFSTPHLRKALLNKGPGLYQILMVYFN